MYLLVKASALCQALVNAQTDKRDDQVKPEEVIGRQIAEIRESAGMTQAELGIELGRILEREWPRQTVSLAEKGRRAFTATELVALSWVLEVPIEQLLIPPPGVARVNMPNMDIASEMLSARLRPSANTDWNDVLMAADLLGAALHTATGQLHLARERSDDLRRQLYGVKRGIDEKAGDGES